ncbi:MAG: hypothetical protein AAGJ82_13600 [Bacteroidota bacterium]
MQFRSLMLIFVSFALFACGNDGKFSEAEIEAQDTAWQTMFDAHDEVMPLTLRDIPDTVEELEELAADAMVEANDFHPRAQQAIADLNAAEEGMQVWMKTIGENQKKKLRERMATHEEIMAFIKAQTDFINQVAEDTHSSIKAGEALIALRKGNDTNE